MRNLKLSLEEIDIVKRSIQGASFTVVGGYTHSRIGGKTVKTRQIKTQKRETTGLPNDMETDSYEYDPNTRPIKSTRHHERCHVDKNNHDVNEEGPQLPRSVGTETDDHNQTTHKHPVYKRRVPE